MHLQPTFLDGAWSVVFGALLCMSALLVASCGHEQLSCDEVRALCLVQLECRGQRHVSDTSCGCTCMPTQAGRTKRQNSRNSEARAEASEAGKSRDSALQRVHQTDSKLTEVRTAKKDSTLTDWQATLSTLERSVRIGIEDLPPSDRVFAIDEDGDGVDELFGTTGQVLWRYSLTESTLRREPFQGGGTVHQMTVGPWLGRRHVFLAKGRGRGVRGDVGVQMRSVGSSSFQTSLYEFSSERNDIAGLSLWSTLGFEQGGVLLTSFVSKYQAQSLLLGPESKVSVFHDEQRMAMHVLPWRISDQLGWYKVVGRIYGDARGEPGDLKVAPFQSRAHASSPRKQPDASDWQSISIDGGVRSLTLADPTGKGVRNLYVSDGWSAAYKREAKAQLKEVSFVDGGFQISEIGRSPSEYTFFEIWARDLDGDGRDEIVARGDRHLTYFRRTATGWQRKRLASFGPILNLALLNRGKLGWFIAIPNGTRTRLESISREKVAL